MFGLFSGGIVKEDASALKRFTDMVKNRYVKETIEETIELIQRDFVDPLPLVEDDGSRINFTFKELPDFLFSINTFGSKLELSVFGTGRYTGFAMFANDEAWAVDASDMAITQATSGAKKLASTLCSMYNINDYSR